LAEAEQTLSPALELFVVLATMALVLLPLALRQTLRRSRARTGREWGPLAVFGVVDALNGGLYFALMFGSISSCRRNFG
jgi:hypothetical protein